jgi:hypothetical protein
LKGISHFPPLAHLVTLFLALTLQYFNNFVELQHLGLNVSCQKLSKNQWLKYIEPYVAELRVSQADDLLKLEILKKAYEATIIPLISLATIQGFTPDWMYL